MSNVIIIKLVQKQRNFIVNFIQLNFNFLRKNDKLAYWGTLSGVWGNALTSSIARWKACGRLPIRIFITSYGSDAISRYWLNLAFFKGGGSL